MKFKSEPNMYVTDHRTHKTICKFDDKGFFETKDKKLIERLKGKFEVVKDEPRRTVK